MMLPPHGSTVYGLHMGYWQIVRLCRLQQNCSQTLRGPHGNNKSYKIKIRIETAICQLSNREAASRRLQGCRTVVPTSKGAVRSLQGLLAMALRRP